MNTHPSSRSNIMLAQMVIRIMSHLQLPRLDPLTTMDDHPNIPPVSPPFILHYGTPYDSRQSITLLVIRTILYPIIRVQPSTTLLKLQLRLTLRLKVPPLDTQTNRTPTPLTYEPIHGTNSPHMPLHPLEGTTSALPAPNRRLSSQMARGLPRIYMAQS
ncbi:uncharacterized protein BJ212DRAFT_1580493 [Suillus subaureus]|uniref:Uncharacterized protein n=1 Tax=Suillus subaureus TaxID=48587 RepID=A0A9P7J7Q9_9AGAM|nr:uncharacterized protein BJ212DRAFT_1580493 [Suillus subaureus]KAG1806985.1 hypothetical protein BJ212DRAFT_1580493 [Suillus subaureus]